MLLQMALFSSFLWLSNIPLYIDVTSSLFIHLSMDILVSSMSWLLQIVLNIEVRVSFQIRAFQQQQDTRPRVGFLGHMVALF